MSVSITRYSLQDWMRYVYEAVLARNRDPSKLVVTMWDDDLKEMVHRPLLESINRKQERGK